MRLKSNDHKSHKISMYMMLKYGKLINDCFIFHFYPQFRHLQANALIKTGEHLSLLY